MRATYALDRSVISSERESVVDVVINLAAEVGEGASGRRPLNLSLVLDRSGSMAGVPLSQAKRAAQSLVDRLSAEDFISIVSYDDHAKINAGAQRANDRAVLHSAISSIRAGGCTNLHQGWVDGCAQVQLNLSDGQVNRVLLLTDGKANCGLREPVALMAAARERAEHGVSTTTLGFGSEFNEDLLIGMAREGSGNFYYIQSFDDAEDVFRIELESLFDIAGQNLAFELLPLSGVRINAVLNNYPHLSKNGRVSVEASDLYTTEEKLLALELVVPAGMPTEDLLGVSYSFKSTVDGVTRTHSGSLTVSGVLGSQAEADAADRNTTVVEQCNRLRIAKAKEEAVRLADKGSYGEASSMLRDAIVNLKAKMVQETYEMAEELDHLDHYAQSLERGGLDKVSRKEMLDQSYQTLTRNRDDLKLRGTASGSSAGLTIVTEFDQGVKVRCVREGGKLRVKVISDGYDHDKNVQFPRHIREEGVTYVVDEVDPSSDGSFYKASGQIRRLLMPGETVRQQAETVRRSGPPKASTAKTLADLESTDTVGNGVLVQCVNDGKKLRARVVSDGYDPNFNMRFPRGIRQEGMLFVVDEVILGPDGASYIACGKIKKLVQ